jgi:hypothetical protein
MGRKYIDMKHTIPHVTDHVNAAIAEILKHAQSIAHVKNEVEKHCGCQHEEKAKEQPQKK